MPTQPARTPAGKNAKGAPWGHTAPAVSKAECRPAKRSEDGGVPATNNSTPTKHMPAPKLTRAERSAINKENWRLRSLSNSPNNSPATKPDATNGEPARDNNETRNADSRKRQDATQPENRFPPTDEARESNAGSGDGNRNDRNNPQSTRQTASRQRESTTGEASIEDASVGLGSGSASPPHADATRDASDRPRSGATAETLPDPPPTRAKKTHSPAIPPDSGFRQRDDDAGDIRWVMEHLHDEFEPRLFPSASARSLWLSARKSPKAEEVFLTQVYAKVFVRREEEEQEKLDRVRRVRIEGMVERCLELCGQVNSGG